MRQATYKSIFALLILCLAPLGLAQPERYIEGRDYLLIENPGPDRSPETVEVVEYFWYGCPGCFQLDPVFEEWTRNQAESVVCSRLPAVWSDRHALHAKMYYTADMLGILDSVHEDIFLAMHRDGERFIDENAIQAFFTSTGVSEEEFGENFNSFALNTQVNRAKTLAAQYNLRSTPSIIINDKYIISGRSDMLDIADFLVAREISAIQ